MILLRIVGAILLGGGAFGVLGGYLLTKALDHRQMERLREEAAQATRRAEAEARMNEIDRLRQEREARQAPRMISQPEQWLEDEIRRKMRQSQPQLTREQIEALLDEARRRRHDA